MKKVIVATLLALMATAAQAKLPAMNASCPLGIELHVEDGGYVYINGKEAKLKAYDESAYDITHGKVTVSVIINPDGSVDASYTKGNEGGICTVDVFAN